MYCVSLCRSLLWRLQVGDTLKLQDPCVDKRTLSFKHPSVPTSLIWCLIAAEISQAFDDFQSGKLQRPSDDVWAA
jgi:hypothetical protein